MVNLHYLHARWTGSMFQWYEYIAALFVPSIGTTDIMIKVEALTNFTKQALLDRTKVIQALNGEQIQMRKAVIHNRMALDILTAAQGWMLCIHSWLIWQCIDCFRWHEKPGKKQYQMKTFLSGLWLYHRWGAIGENYIYHCCSCLDSSALCTLNFAIYYELCNPKLDVILPNW